MLHHIKKDRIIGVENSRIKNTTRNLVAGVIYKVINLSFPFVINTIIIKTLGVEFLGLNMLFASILQVLCLTELGFGTALVFSMYEPIAKGDTAKVSALLHLYRNVYLIIGCIIFGGGMICIPILPHIINGEVPNGINIYILFIISLTNTVIGYFLFAYRSSLFIANQRKDITEKINIIIEIAMNCSKVVILIVTKNYYLFCMLQPLYTVVNSLLVWTISKKMYPQFKCEGVIPRKEKKAIFSRVVGVSINKLCNVVSNSFDSIIISSFLGITILGQYNNYFVIANAIMLLLYILPVSATSSIGNSLVCESREKNFRDFNILQLGFNILLGWAAICLACLTQPFVKIWLGEELMFDNAIVIILGVYLYSIVSSAVFMAYREAAGIWEHDRVRPFLEAGLNLAINILMVRFIGIAGVLISTIITMGIIRLIWGSYYLFNELFTEQSHGRYLLKQMYSFIVTAGAGTVTYLVVGYIDMEGILGLIVKGLVCAVLAMLLLVGGYIRTKEFKGIIDLAMGILHRKQKGEK